MFSSLFHICCHVVGFANPRFNMISATLDNALRLFNEGVISEEEYEEIMDNHIDFEIDSLKDNS